MNIKLDRLLSAEVGEDSADAISIRDGRVQFPNLQNTTG